MARAVVRAKKRFTRFCVGGAATATGLEIGIERCPKVSAAKSNANICELSRPARRPPSSAPSVLAISKRNARLTSALRPGRETLATAADVAMTPIRLAPTATRIGNPNRRVNAGTRKMPPPNPSIAPNIPATSPVPANAKTVSHIAGPPAPIAWPRPQSPGYVGGHPDPARQNTARSHARQPLIKRWHAHLRSVRDQIMPDIISPSHATQHCRSPHQRGTRSASRRR